jgi:hypothetical protein
VEGHPPNSLRSNDSHEGTKSRRTLLLFLFALSLSKGYCCIIMSENSQSMTQAELSKAKNPKLRGSLAAMRRAAEIVRKTAIETDTGVVVVRDGKRLFVSAAELRMGEK